MTIPRITVPMVTSIFTRGSASIRHIPDKSRMQPIQTISNAAKAPYLLRRFESIAKIESMPLPDFASEETISVYRMR
jgi:hypothetical protein